MSQIHPTAIVEEGAQLGEGVTLEPYAVVGKHVSLGNGVTVKSHAVIEGHTTIGDDTIVYPFASIGTKSQDKRSQGETTYVRIGKGCEIREAVTINASSGEGTAVTIGDHCLIMAYCHVAHNCTLGNHVVMSNGSQMAGHVTVEDHVIIGGMTPIHQHVRIGKYAMVGGLSRVTNDIPPFTIGGGIPYKFGGLNVIGLKRHHFDFETRRHLTHAFRLTYRSGLRLDEAIDRIQLEVEPIPEVKQWVEFCQSSKRGLLGIQGTAKSEAYA
jgi:UDP-N-acetylglucosamine acyltransferase